MDSLQPRSPASRHQVKYIFLQFPTDSVFLMAGNSPSSTPVSAKSPGPEEEEQEPPQLSVKREFSLAAGGGKRENSEGAVVAVNDEEEDSVKECKHEKDVHFAVLLGLISVPDTTNEKG